MFLFLHISPFVCFSCLSFGQGAAGGLPLPPTCGDLHVHQSPGGVGLIGSFLSNNENIKGGHTMEKHCACPLFLPLLIQFLWVGNMNAQSASMRTVSEQNPQQCSKWFFQLEKSSGGWERGGVGVGGILRYTSPKL